MATPPPELLEFALLGRPLQARLRTPRLRRWLVERWRFDEHEAPPHPYRITIEEAPRPPGDLASTAAGAPPADARRSTGRPEEADVGATAAQLPGITLQWRRREPWWWTGGAEGGVAACFRAAGAQIRLWGASGAAPEVFAALYLAVNEALRASGLIPLHAAVAVKGKEALALVAPSGTGKSTTLLRLLAAGWSPLAEDLSWLDPESLTLYGWDRGIRLWPPSVPAFVPHLAGAPWSTDPDGKLFLGYDALGTRRVPSARLTRIVRLEREVDGVAIEAALSPACRPAQPVPPATGQHGQAPTPLSPRESVRVFWEATGVPMLPSSRATLARHVPEILRSVAFCRVGLGSEPELLPPLLPPPGNGS